MDSDDDSLGADHDLWTKLPVPEGFALLQNSASAGIVDRNAPTSHWPRHRRTRSRFRIRPVAFAAGRNDAGHIRSAPSRRADAGARAIRAPKRPQHLRDQTDASGSGSTPAASVECAISTGGDVPAGVYVVCVVAVSPMLVADLRPEAFVWPISSVPPQLVGDGVPGEAVASVRSLVSLPG